MFSKKSLIAEPLNAFLGEGAEFEGTLTFASSVRIDGKFKGTINSTGSLIIGERGEVKADVSAGSLVLMGELHGNVSTGERTEISSTGKLTGELSSPIVVIQEGGMLEGRVHMDSGRQGDTGDETNLLDFSSINNKRKTAI